MSTNYKYKIHTINNYHPSDIERQLNKLKDDGFEFLGLINIPKKMPLILGKVKTNGKAKEAIKKTNKS